MFHLAHGCASCSPDIHRPFPSRLIGCPSNRHTANLDELELSFRECTGFVRLIKSLQDYIQHREFYVTSPTVPTPPPAAPLSPYSASLQTRAADRNPPQSPRPPANRLSCPS